jgi:hypothetical protein
MSKIQSAKNTAIAKSQTKQKRSKSLRMIKP